VRLEVRARPRTLTGTYPEVRAALASQRDRELLLDGEVVAFKGEETSFSRLQQPPRRHEPLSRAGGRVSGPSSVSLTCSKIDGDDVKAGRCSSAARA